MGKIIFHIYFTYKYYSVCRDFKLIFKWFVNFIIELISVRNVMLKYNFALKICYGVHGGIPVGTNGKEPTCQCRRQKRFRFDPWVGKIPWRRAWQPTAVFLPGESHGQRSLMGYSP